MNIERGNIYRVNLDPTIGSEQQGNARPCVVLTLTAYNRQLRTVGVVPLTLSPRALAPLIVPILPLARQVLRHWAIRFARLIKPALANYWAHLARMTWPLWKMACAGCKACE